MIAFLVAVLAVVAVLSGGLHRAFVANVGLNTLILGVFVLGVAYNFRQVLMLYPEVAWIERFRRDRGGALADGRAPRLLAPMATMLGERRDHLRLSALALRSLLDSISSRLDESRDISRYTIGLMVFLGLLGTFWGLMETVASVGDVIRGLTAGSGDVAGAFENLKTGLASPLSGMGTAFSSSLFGLAGSLVLGFLDLQANQAQNHFYNDLEEWLSSQTRLSSGGPLSGDTGDASVPAYVQALLEQTAESLENLQRTMARGEESRIASNSTFLQMVDRLGTLTDHMRTEQQVMMRLAETQNEIRPVLQRLSDAMEARRDGGVDEATRTHIRNLDVYMARLVDDVSTGRDQVVKELRSEIKLLARTIAALADGRDR
jgi:hypothetical protein